MNHNVSYVRPRWKSRQRVGEPKVVSSVAPQRRPASSWPASAFAGLVVALVSACGGKAAESAAPRAVLTVDLVSPATDAWPDVLAASGEVAPWQEAIIGAEVPGIRLDEVLVNVGDAVKKGQLLARYREDMLRADLAQMDAAVIEAKANLAKAEADAVRADKMAEINGVSEQAREMTHTQAEVARAQLDSARAQRDVQTLRLKNAHIVAPDDGLISSRSATVGSVSTMGAELFRLVRGNRLEWRAELPAESLARLRPGVAVTLQGLGGVAVAGTVRQVSPTVDSGTRNGIAYVDLPRNSGLAAGQYLSGRFALPARDALAIPESSIVLRDGNRYLMKVDEQSRVREVKVATGRREGGAIEILEGISASERFIRSGGAFVTDGDLVRIAPVTASTP